MALTVFLVVFGVGELLMVAVFWWWPWCLF